MTGERLVALIGAQGGCGTTRLAIDRARATGAVLVDADLHHGDVAERVGLVPSSAAWLAGGLESEFTPTTGSGAEQLPVVVSPSDPLIAEQVPETRAAEIVASVANPGARPVVVDLGSRLGIHAAHVIRAVDLVVIVADGRPAQIRIVGQLATTIARLSPDAAVRLALPRMGATRAARLFAAGCELQVEPTEGATQVPAGALPTVRSDWLSGARRMVRQLAGGPADA